MRRRPGFTLIEVVIAILVFAIGGLGLAASSAAIARQISTSTIRQRAVSIARDRAERASATPCDGIVGGSAVDPAIRSAWSVAGSAVRTLDQQLDRTDSRGTRTDTFLSAVPCE